LAATSTKMQEVRQKVAKDLGYDPFRDASIIKPRLPSGILTLDAVLDGGLVMGTYNEFFGNESVGKTYLATLFAAQTQRHFNRPVVWADFEGSFSPERAQAIGVDLDPERFILMKPRDAETGWDALIDIIETDEVGLVVIDSLSAMVPMAELEKEMDRELPAKQARLNSKAFRVATAVLENTIIIMINQMRTNVGVMFGNPNTTSGGKSVKHYAHRRLELKSRDIKAMSEEYDPEKEVYENKEVKVGHRITVDIRKNKNGPPERRCHLDYMYATGAVDLGRDRLRYFNDRGMVTKSGNFLSIEGINKDDGTPRKLQGQKKAAEFLGALPDEEIDRLMVIAIEKGSRVLGGRV
jgi:recombination protein RecA